jgi:hypothetical protein
MPKPEKFRLKGEDMREDKELATHVARSLAVELCQSLPGAVRQVDHRPKAAQANCVFLLLPNPSWHKQYLY